MSMLFMSGLCSTELKFRYSVSMFMLLTNSIYQVVIVWILFLMNLRYNLR